MIYKQTSTTVSSHVLSKNNTLVSEWRLVFQLILEIRIEIITTQKHLKLSPHVQKQGPLYMRNNWLEMGHDLDKRKVIVFGSQRDLLSAENLTHSIHSM